ncbi:hypothetical protein E3P92_00404 [Wallemia ichthyophaga]|uniref:Uncharacterized protein n=2 Tax=Wallemia ichthyophaga TaxID=245174 RepID=A0A4T0GTN8_WALIC|nr:uncharacterized protein J056_004787 [Wallemia ichthyophaga EXF-994]TIA74907.1 hypothetical protein E3P91_00760 [Wallemia ichthyophaga]EOR00975.1 hypothetical protein J056_004787 [Wallemia ichthyophaga EXF-994]TIA81648.1 hypothetical protein E3P98_01940 [Wallemia ichthyophaga]TIA94118.1 hypothetical protein E3P97_00366 [Wallemia ichthyophaga]TIA99933.1 hypothetical protein E3P96_02777 [Wallemia ichthyophaga]
MSDFNTQPHEATTNDPNGPKKSIYEEHPTTLSHPSREPHIPSKEKVEEMGKPLSREELNKRIDELNK